MVRDLHRDLEMSDLRQRLRSVAPTDADFNAFVIDRFPAEIARRLSVPVDLLAKENLLLSLVSADELAAALVEHGDGSMTRHRHLREPIGSFIGRNLEVQDIRARLLRNKGTAFGICIVRGLGGLGKTELVLKVAADLRKDFPMQFFVELRGQSDASTSPEEALRMVLHAMHPTWQLPDERAALDDLYRQSLVRRQVLIVADDARDAEQVRALVPPADCALLVTTRNRFSSPAWTQKHALDLATLSREQAAELLQQQCGRLSSEEAAVLAAECGDLPKALQAAASLLENDPTQRVPDYLESLKKYRTRLEHLRSPDDPHLDVEATLRLSYDALASHAKALRQLGVMPQSFDMRAAEAVLKDCGASVKEAMAMLYKRCLLDWESQRDRYSLHDLVRALAQKLASDTETASAQHHHAVHFSSVLRDANQMYWMGGDHVMKGLEWFDTEQAHILSAQAWAASQAPFSERATATVCVDLALNGTHLLELRMPPARRLLLYEVAAKAAEILDDRRAQARALGNVGNAYRDLGRHPEAIPYYEQRLAIARGVGDRISEGVALGDLGAAYRSLGQIDKAIELHEAQLAIAEADKIRPRVGVALGNLGMAYADRGELAKAIAYHQQNLMIVREGAHRRSEGIVLYNLAHALWQTGERAQALLHMEESLRIRNAMRDPKAELTWRTLVEWRTA